MLCSPACPGVTEMPVTAASCQETCDLCRDWAAGTLCFFTDNCCCYFAFDAFLGVNFSVNFLLGIRSIFGAWLLYVNVTFSVRSLRRRFIRF